MLPILHALLVEDNPADARLLREVVAETGKNRLRLSHEDRLGKALLRLEREHFDVILLDLSLPDAEGLDTLKRAHSHSPAVPIVVLTGLDDEALALAAVREGAQDYLVKGSVDSNLLLRTIKYATERKRSIEALRNSEEHFRSLIENALDIITVLNPDGTVRYASPSLERVVGHKAEDLTERSMFELVQSAGQGTLRDLVQAALGSPGTTHTLRFWMQHLDGSWRVLEAIGRSLLDTPEVNGVVVNSRDITERTLTEEKLARANETLRAVILASPLAICTLDGGNRVKSWNPAAQRIFGWSEAELLDRPLPIITEDDQAAFEQRLQRARLSDPMVGLEVLNRRKDGSHINVSIWTAALGGSGGSGGLVVAVADNTERKRLEEQFRQSQRMESVGRLAGAVAHDFNNLLTVITGYSEMVLGQLLTNDPIKEDMTQILRASDRATTLTKQLLAFTRHQVVQPKILDVGIILKETEPMLRRLTGEPIQLTLHLQPHLGHVRADAAQLEQVIVNLVVNARDAMPSGGKLTIETANVELDDSYARQHLSAHPGRYIMVAVSDNGVGIDPKILPHLFEPFFTTKEKGKGTGLGLSTSYGIVQQNGGSIYVYSEPGKGSTFKVYLPRVDEPLSADQRDSQRAKWRGGDERVLLVEDEEGVRGVVYAMLQRLGYGILVAREWSEAIVIYDENPDAVNLLLTDMVMPGRTGQELAAELRARCPALKVVFMSGYTDNALIAQGELEPGTAFLQKPFTPEELAITLREVLDKA